VKEYVPGRTYTENRPCPSHVTGFAVGVVKNSSEYSAALPPLMVSVIVNEADRDRLVASFDTTDESNSVGAFAAGHGIKVSFDSEAGLTPGRSSRRG
jgi:hypothetical protein